MQCDSCELWFHLLCVGLGDDDVNDEEDYVCFKCTTKVGGSLVIASTDDDSISTPLVINSGLTDISQDEASQDSVSQDKIYTNGITVVEDSISDKQELMDTEIVTEPTEDEVPLFAPSKNEIPTSEVQSTPVQSAAPIIEVA